MDERQQQLQDWARLELGLSGESVQWSSVAGDASSRRYFRLGGQSAQSWICMDAPPATEKNTAFLDIRTLLERNAVRVPALLAVELECGFMVLEDLGDRLLLPELNATCVDARYQQAMVMLLELQAAPTAGGAVPAYSEEVLAEELSRFPEWFCEGLLQMELAPSQRAMIGELVDRLVVAACEQPRVLVHRDFHSRNLLLLPDDAIATIDFQDAVTGPLCYDLVSLLKDCYICWPQAQVRAWALSYREQLLALGRPAAADAQQFLRWFDWIGLQRHLKVLGNFSRLALRDGKDGYIKDIPLVLHYIVEALANYEEFEAVLAWFTDSIVPGFEQLTPVTPQ
jgi:aminoglycoside/choline kinase family phosphotransferase